MFTRVLVAFGMAAAAVLIPAVPAAAAPERVVITLDGPSGLGCLSGLYPGEVKGTQRILQFEGVKRVSLTAFTWTIYDPNTGEPLVVGRNQRGPIVLQTEREIRGDGTIRFITRLGFHATFHGAAVPPGSTSTMVEVQEAVGNVNAPLSPIGTVEYLSHGITFAQNDRIEGGICDWLDAYAAANS